MSDYLKPQSPLYDKKEDAYFYPLTTADQVIMENGNRLNTVFKSTVRKTVTLLANNWSADAPYTQTITFSDVNFDDLNVDAHVAYTGNKESDLELSKGYSCVSYVTKDGNSITFSCLKDKPVINMPVEIVGTSCDSIANVEEGSGDPVLQDKNVTPSTNPQSIVADEGFDGLGVVNIEGDADLVSTNIIKGATIFGVAGSYEGLELNFDVKRYSSEELLMADAPIENTIGIVSDTEISKWLFDTTEPENPVDDMLWIKIDSYSHIEFSAVKDTNIPIYPICAKQYISGAWVDVLERIYQNGKWVDWWDGMLYSAGDECSLITGGWSITKTAAGSATKAASEVNVRLKGTGAAVGFILNTNEKVSVTNFSTLSAIVSDVSQTVGQGTFVKTYFGLFEYLPSSVTMRNIDSLGVVKTRINNGNTNISVDVSGITGEYYIAFFSALGGSASYYVNYNVKEAKLA